ncbi:hypothetical protein TBLA_0A05650 [Henningerozyma blattae CBS 6284]|uniref:Ubiquinone biosynthesis monooxygenase COQ6, mitochondrial n=1 Tax=Henningerozyma blattae (strain ATCC 34711 / CBS 6284 / DSM 70876 / NBRC 10599 / NRRL Y-10934 / UCD 77-7) TaxID=1071380 RepID=I2GW56_HENB6|nr:hypothetical protein TBLA_0A05650 [Tetrapisispora blattae CBS 6284]CCH58358.1 hypothetical protein TBLA_0A05650 [Tetrapisispora blattae CBS 6284]
MLKSYNTAFKLVRHMATSASKSPKLTDVFIVGGGPAGLGLATGIKTSSKLKHLNTVLVDGGDIKGKVAPFYDNPPDFYTNRVVSVTHPTREFIEDKLGATLRKDRIMSYDGICVTDGVSKGLIDMERPGMAWMVEILNVQSSLLNRINQLKPSGFNLLDKTKVVDIKYSDPEDASSWILVSLDNGETYKTRLLIGADGFNSRVKTFSGILSQGWFYNKSAVVATMKLDMEPLKIRGWQRFLPTGPIAHLPLPGDNATLVWSTTNELAKLLTSIPVEQFTELVNAAFVLEDVDMKYYYNQLMNGKMTTTELKEDVQFRTNQILASLSDESMADDIYPPPITDVLDHTRAKFPLKLFHADTYCQERIALLGDAAHATHPLAGQGLNMGLCDTDALVRALESATDRGLDVGSLFALEPFWSERYPINCKLLSLADNCHKIYSNTFPPIVGMRTLGANIINQIGPIKDYISGTLSYSGKY